jgi:hypothetical protein
MTRSMFIPGSCGSVLWPVSNPNPNPRPLWLQCHCSCYSSLFWTTFLIALRPFLSALLCDVLGSQLDVKRMHIRCHRDLLVAIETKQIPNRQPLVCICRYFLHEWARKARPRRTLLLDLLLLHRQGRRRCLGRAFCPGRREVAVLVKKASRSKSWRSLGDSAPENDTRVAKVRLRSVGFKQTEPLANAPGPKGSSYEAWLQFCGARSRLTAARLQAAPAAFLDLCTDREPGHLALEAQNHWLVLPPPPQPATRPVLQKNWP